MHRNLPVHRDLKPVTVLVDTEGQVKLLDFGIAKAVDPLEGAGAAEGNSTVGGVRPTGRNATTPAEAARNALEQAPTRPSRRRPTKRYSRSGCRHPSNSKATSTTSC